MQYARTKLIELATKKVNDAKNDIVIIQKLFEKNGYVYTITYQGDSLIRNAAVIDVYESVVSGLLHDVTLEDLRGWVLDSIMSKAKYVEASTSACKNAVEREVLAVKTTFYSELLSHITELTG